MKPQAFQPGEIRGPDDNIIRPGAYGKHSPLVDARNEGSLDYIMNNLDVLYNMIQGAYVFVDTKADLPVTGQTDKFYVTKNDGKTYVWDGKEYQERTVAINGLSAYELAKLHGFPGSEVDWLDGQLNRDIIGPSPAHMADAHLITCAGPQDMTTT